jgi:hypothetical protein
MNGLARSPDIHLSFTSMPFTHPSISTQQHVGVGAVAVIYFSVFAHLSPPLGCEHNYSRQYGSMSSPSDTRYGTE